jgi:hypothetical protein
MPSLKLRAIPGSENSPAGLTAPAGGEILAVTSLASRAAQAERQRVARLAA